MGFVKHSMMVVMVMTLLQPHLGEKVADDWFSEYGEKRDMMAEYPDGSVSGARSRECLGFQGKVWLGEELEKVVTKTKTNMLYFF